VAGLFLAGPFLAGPFLAAPEGVRAAVAAARRAAGVVALGPLPGRLPGVPGTVVGGLGAGRPRLSGAGHRRQLGGEITLGEIILIEVNGETLCWHARTSW
jgi:hypothetical protein